MEKKTGNQMETGVIKGLYRDPRIGMIPIGHENLYISPALGYLDQVRASPSPSPLVPYWNTLLLSDSGIPQ